MDLGFDSKKEIEINNTKIKPISFIKKVLEKIQVPKGYEEVENIWVNIEGIKNGKKINKELNCIVKTQKRWENAGSNVNTGRTISIISQMLKNGKNLNGGVFAPEAIVSSKEFFEELSKREMYVYMGGKRVN